MAKNKPTKPTNLMPRSFGGEKNNFSDDLITNGFEINVPQTYNGDNLNYQLNATGKEFEYIESVVDYIVAMPSNNILTVNSNNQLDYKNLNTLATDTSVVHKSGDETVAGTKTFSNTIVGSVNGNANTATNDIDGNPIKTTYQKVSNLSQVINESTTKYPSCNAVKTAIDAKDSLPSQTGNAGKFLTTDGTNASWKNSYTPPLLSCMWSDHLLSDMSWLRADTFSWQDGTTYSLIYNELLSEYNNSASTAEKEGSIIFKRTPKGYKIALKTQETAILNKYNSDGIAWYYILDTTNTRFKLPRTKFGFEGLRTNVGDDIEAGLPNITGNIGSTFRGLTGVANGAFRLNNDNAADYGAEAGSFMISKTASLNASRSSSIYGNSDTVQPPATQMYLYFFVGNYTQSAIQQTAGLNSELFNGKMDINHANDTKPYITDTYTNGLSWYRVWSDGWCEQGGQSATTGAASTVTTVNFLKPFANVNYCALATDYATTTNVVYFGCTSFTTSSMAIITNAGAGRACRWMVAGYIN